MRVRVLALVLVLAAAAFTAAGQRQVNDRGILPPLLRRRLTARRALVGRAPHVAGREGCRGGAGVDAGVGIVVLVRQRKLRRGLQQRRAGGGGSSSRARHSRS